MVSYNLNSHLPPNAVFSLQTGSRRCWLVDEAIEAPVLRENPGGVERSPEEVTHCAETRALALRGMKTGQGSGAQWLGAMGQGKPIKSTARSGRCRHTGTVKHPGHTGGRVRGAEDSLGERWAPGQAVRGERGSVSAGSERASAHWPCPPIPCPRHRPRPERMARAAVLPGPLEKHSPVSCPSGEQMDFPP